MNSIAAFLLCNVTTRLSSDRPSVGPMLVTGLLSTISPGLDTSVCVTLSSPCRLLESVLVQLLPPPTSRKCLSSVLVPLTPVRLRPSYTLGNSVWNTFLFGRMGVLRSTPLSMARWSTIPASRKAWITFTCVIPLGRMRVTLPLLNR